MFPPFPCIGRQFYKCPRQQGTGCDFFLWADQDAVPPNSVAPPISGPAIGNMTGHQPVRQPGFLSARRGNQRGGASRGCVSSSGGVSVVMCKCEEEAVVRTVQKEGPNKGKQFYTCSKPREQQCQFFEWSDQLPPSSIRSYSARGGRGHGRGGENSWRATHNKNASSASASGEGKKRAPPTCSMCREVGHTKRTCPLKS